MYWMSGTNKHVGSPKSTVDKRREAPTNKGKGRPSHECRDEREAAVLDGSESLSACLHPVSDLNC